MEKKAAKKFRLAKPAEKEGEREKAWTRVRAAVLEALERDPEAREAVAQALKRELEGR